MPHHGSLRDVEDARRTLAHLEAHYPGFCGWFASKVVPGLGVDRLLIVRRSGCSVRGVAIAKRTPEERKLCTLWVDPSARGQGLGGALMAEALDWLDDPLPLVTVPDGVMAEASGLLRAHRFHHAQTIASAYGAGRDELVFNGSLIPAAPMSFLPDLHRSGSHHS